MDMNGGYMGPRRATIEEAENGYTVSGCDESGKPTTIVCKTPAEAKRAAAELMGMSPGGKRMRKAAERVRRGMSS